jgi:hypothetical protein
LGIGDGGGPVKLIRIGIFMKKKLFFIFGFFTFGICFAQTNTERLISLDLNYLITGLLNQGGGIGVNYEQGIANYFSVKGGFGHMLFKTGIEDVYCASVNLSVFINYYPFGRDLDKVYIGIGNGCDFMNYFGDGILPKEGGDVLISFTPITGYKFNFKPLTIDVNIGYKFVINDSTNYSDIEYYVNKGIQLGLGFNFHLKELKTVLKKEK